MVLIGGATAAVAATDRRTVGAFLDDKAIVVKATSAIQSAVGPTEEIHINVTSFNGIVLLSGEAPNTDARDQVLAAVRKVAGVRRTVNEIRIAPVSSASVRASDSWLTSKIKATLAGVNGLDSSQVKVVTEYSAVYLMGLVTKREGELAATKAAELDGVARVVKIFEYID